MKEILHAKRCRPADIATAARKRKEHRDKAQSGRLLTSLRAPFRGFHLSRRHAQGGRFLMNMAAEALP